MPVPTFALYPAPCFAPFALPSSPFPSPVLMIPLRLIHGWDCLGSLGSWGGVVFVPQPPTNHGGRIGGMYKSWNSMAGFFSSYPILDTRISSFRPAPLVFQAGTDKNVSLSWSWWRNWIFLKLLENIFSAIFFLKNFKLPLHLSR